MKSIPLKPAGIAVTSALLLWAIFGTLSYNGSALAQQNGEPCTLTVNGTGTVFAVADTIIVEIGVEEIGSNVNQPYELVQASLTDIRSGLIEAGIDAAEIRSMGILITPEDRLDNSFGPTGEFLYRISGIYQVTVSAAQFQLTIDTAVGSGANTVRNVMVTASPELLVSLEERSRELALADALNQADAIALQLDLERGRAVTVNEPEIRFTLPEEEEMASGRVSATSSLQVTYLLEGCEIALPTLTPSVTPTATATATQTPTPTALATEMPAATPVSCQVIAAEPVSQYSAPDQTASVTGTLDDGLPTAAVGRVPGADGFVWWLLDDESWVRADSVIESADCGRLPVVTDAP